jgi:hypothetical protein
MSACDVDDTAAAKQTPGPPRNFPGLEKLLSGQTPRLAHCPAKPIEQGGAAESAQIVPGQPRFGRPGKPGVVGVIRVAGVIHLDP